MPILDKSKAAQERYWSERAERIILAAEKTAEQIISGQHDAWQNAERAIIREIEAFYGRYAHETGLTIAEVQQRLNKTQLNAAKADIARYYAETERLGLDPKYRTYLRNLSARAYMSRLEELKVHVRHEIEVVAGKQQEVLGEGLRDTYEESYNRTIFNIQQGIGVGRAFTRLNTQSVSTAVNQKWLGENYSDRIWTNKDRLVANLDRIIPRGMALGQNPRIIAKDINAAMQTGRYNAERLARTEFNHIANNATLQGYSNSGVDEYKILATLDNRTSEICQEMDGKRFKVSEAMVGINYPVFHPHCRTTTVPYFPPDEIDAMFAESSRLARDPDTGKNYYVPASMTYKDWLKR